MRIVLTGSHSVGKTTILREIDLLEHVKIEEAARQVIYEIKKMPHEMSSHEYYEFQFSVAKKQIESEKVKHFISDRCLYDTMAYARDLEDSSLIKSIEDYILDNLTPYDFVFYIPVEFDLKVDDVRKNSREYQLKIDKQLQQVLKDFKVPYITLTGDINDRLAQFYRVIKRT